MAVQLSKEDFERLADILSQHGDWQSVRSRIDFMAAVFAGSPRKDDLLPTLDLDGDPHGTAVRVIEKLSCFGEDAPGHETLFLLLDRLGEAIGGGDGADFLRDVRTRIVEPADRRDDGGKPAMDDEIRFIETTLRAQRQLRWLLAGLALGVVALGVACILGAPA